MIPLSLVDSEVLCASVGDFFSIYRNRKNQWDCIVTCFYIDRVKNVIRLIKLIHQCLRNQGVWINYGSLHYDQAEIELSV
jgi:carnosine N-methyltransferase